MTITPTLRRLLHVSALSIAVASVVPALAQSADAQKGGDKGQPAMEEHAQTERQNWTFAGLTGYFDQQQLRRGYKVYKTVCANCHSMKLMYFRNLGQPGGPEFPKEVVDQLASEYQVPDEDKNDGSIRPAKASDHFVWQFKTPQEAIAALGALPPDLSVITKARSVEREVAWYATPFVMLKDLATQYQEQGPDYIYAVLNGYKDPPPGKEVASGLYYNVAFPGHQLAMPQPLTDGAVDFEDGTPNTLQQEAKDVVTFLAWASEPHQIERKKLGLRVLVYLLIVAVLLGISKQTLWRNVKH